MFPPLNDVNIAAGIDGSRRDPAEFPAGRQRVLGLLGELDIDAVLEQTTFVRIPTLIAGDSRDSAQQKRSSLEFHMILPVFDSSADR